MSVIDITLKGRPATKKNSGRIVFKNGKRIIIPSEAYENYEDACLWQLAGKKLHISGIIVVECKYYLPNKRSWPDLILSLIHICAMWSASNRSASHSV